MASVPAPVVVNSCGVSVRAVPPTEAEPPSLSMYNHTLASEAGVPLEPSTVKVTGTVWELPRLPGVAIGFGEKGYEPILAVPPSLWLGWLLGPEPDSSCSSVGPDAWYTTYSWSPGLKAEV